MLTYFVIKILKIYQSDRELSGIFHPDKHTQMHKMWNPRSWILPRQEIKTKTTKKHKIFLKFIFESQMDGHWIELRSGSWDMWNFAGYQILWRHSSVYQRLSVMLSVRTNVAQQCTTFSQTPYFTEDNPAQYMVVSTAQYWIFIPKWIQMYALCNSDCKYREACLLA